MTREEAIAILQEEIDGNLKLSLREWEERDEQKLFPAIRMAIEALQAEPVKHGEWVDYGDCEDICSICGYSKVHEPNYPFCPNCGADMRERKEE